MKYWCVVVCALSVAGCGGGSGLPETRPHGTVSGHVIDGPIIGAEVKAYSYLNGTKGGLLAEAVTNGESYYELSIQSNDQPILLEIRNGFYVEEASNASITLHQDHTLKALFNYDSNARFTVNITPYTHLATGLTEYYIGTGSSVGQAISQASTEMTNVFGLNVQNTTPSVITKNYDAPLSLDNASLYGFLLAGLSGYTQSVASQNQGAVHGDYPTIEFSRLMYEDIKSDGILNGFTTVNGEPVQLSFGGVALSERMYRNAIPQKMLTMANSSINKTGITPEILLSSVSQLSTQSSPLIPNLHDIPPLDIEGPVITAEVNEHPQSQLITFSVAITDETEIASVRFDFDGLDLGEPEDMGNPAIVFDSREVNGVKVTDGIHHIGVKAEDGVGNFSYKRFPVVIDNTPPLVTVLSSLVVNDFNYDLKGAVTFDGAAIESLAVTQGEQRFQVVLADDLTWQLALFLEPGRNEVTLEVKDVANNILQNQVLIAVDKGVPSIAPRYSDAKLTFERKNSVYEGDLEEAEIDENSDAGSRPLVYIEAADISLGQVNFTEELLITAGIPYIALQISDKAFFGVSTLKDEIKVSLKYTLGESAGEWVLLSNGVSSTDNDSMKYFIPLVTEVLGDKFATAKIDQENLIEVRAEDKAGNIRMYAFRFRVEISADAPAGQSN